MSQQYQGIRSKGLVVTAAALLAAPLASYAAAPTLDEVLKASGIGVEGYLDTAYNYLDGTGVFTSGIANRVFDGEDNGFALNQFAVKISKLPEKGAGGVLNVTMGDDADLIAAAGSGDPQYLGTDNFDVTQAYLQYACGQGLTLIAGKYVTASGAEVIWTPANVNLSRSILFGYAIPFGHTGVRATYKMSDAVSVFGGLNNGWDQQTDLNEQKTVELGTILTPSSALSVAAVVYSGSEPGNTGVNGTRNLFDMVATFVVSDKLSLVLNADWAKQDDAIAAGTDAEWSGLAAYANYGFNSQWRGSLRGELLDDEDGYRTGGVPQKWKEISATVAYAAASNLDLLAEVRSDFSDKDTFDTSDGPEDSQNSLGLKAVLKF